MEPKKQDVPFKILLADDDRDDRFFFEKALHELPIHTKLETITDGEKLMAYLINISDDLPDVLFLDLNMPRKSGSECLKEIKNNEKLKQLPVIIYSTSLHEDVADLLYKKGAHYYVRKTEFAELKIILHSVLILMLKKGFTKPSRDEFIINVVQVKPS